MWRINNKWPLCPLPAPCLYPPPPPAPCQSLLQAGVGGIRSARLCNAYLERKTTWKKKMGLRHKGSLAERSAGSLVLDRAKVVDIGREWGVRLPDGRLSREPSPDGRSKAYCKPLGVSFTKWSWSCLNQTREIEFSKCLKCIELLTCFDSVKSLHQGSFTKWYLEENPEMFFEQKIYLFLSGARSQVVSVGLGHFTAC